MGVMRKSGGLMGASGRLAVHSSCAIFLTRLLPECSSSFSKSLPKQSGQLDRWRKVCLDLEDVADMQSVLVGHYRRFTNV